MEGRGGVGVKNIQRKMNYPLSSGGGNKNNWSKQQLQKGKLKKPERKTGEWGASEKRGFEKHIPGSLEDHVHIQDWTNVQRKHEMTISSDLKLHADRE